MEYMVIGAIDSLREGQLVVAEVTAFPDEKVEPSCKIKKVLGELTSVASIGKLIEYKHSLPGRFTRATEKEARNISDTIPVAQREDLRHLNFVTIDGKHAKDFDDAVCIERTKDGFVLYVAIADVSHYVPTGSALDKEAYERGASVYFPDRVIPMLPKSLSNGICSLNPREDRLGVTAKLRFNGNGDLTGSSFHLSVMRSLLRLTFTKMTERHGRNLRPLWAT